MSSEFRYAGDSPFIGSANSLSSANPRQQAFLALKSVHGGAYADVALNRFLSADFTASDRRLYTELLYGCTRRLRTLDTLIDQLATKPAHRQPPEVRTLLHLGLYQLRYLDTIPSSAAVNTTVELAKHNRLSGLAGFINGVLRHYSRTATEADPLALPQDPVQQLGIRHSYPDWLIQLWLNQVGPAATESLCLYLNQPPALDLRINPLKTDLATVQAAFAAAEIPVEPLPLLPQALRVQENAGPVPQLPGFEDGWWTVQDASAQLVSHVVNPHPGAVVIDLCAAPGGKTTHLAELMQGEGKLWGCDRTPSRLRKLKQNLERLQLNTVQLWTGDGRQLPDEIPLADYVLVDAPCSGLGTLHRHADARWQQTPENISALAILQLELLAGAARHTKPGGVIVYATCTLHPEENEGVIHTFLTTHPNWTLTELAPDHHTAPFRQPEGWLKVWPHQHAMDGFFVARMQQR